MLSAERRPTKPTTAPSAPKLSPGEIAARAFECFEQRQSLAEVVIALRVEPKVVRELFHEWQVSLTQGELSRDEVSLPPEDAAQKVGEDELARLLCSLPTGDATRISVGRVVTGYEVDHVSHLEVVELGGFVARGPLALRDLTHRYGSFAFRVSAYDMQQRRLLWEVVLDDPIAHGLASG